MDWLKRTNQVASQVARFNTCRLFSLGCIEGQSLNSNNFLFCNSFRKRSLHLIQKSAHPCMLKIFGASSSLCMSIKSFCLVGLHLFIGMPIANHFIIHGKTSSLCRSLNQACNSCHTFFRCSRYMSKWLSVRSLSCLTVVESN